MDTDVKTGLSMVFWVVGVLFLIWNIFGCYIYYMDMTMTDAAYAQSYGEAMAEARNLYPAWSVAAYAIAVWSGLLAALFYLLRKKWAVPVFILSLITAVISFAWGFTNADYKAAAGGSFWIMPVVVVVIGLFEVWWSRKKTAELVLR